MWTQIRLLLQEQSDLGSHCLSKRLQIWVDKTYVTFVICALRVNKCEFSVYKVRISLNARTFARPKQLINSSPNYKVNPDFPSSVDEIVEPRPDMNSKVAAFTASEKSKYSLRLIDIHVL